MILKQSKLLFIIIVLLGLNSCASGQLFHPNPENQVSTRQIAQPGVQMQKISSIQAYTPHAPISITSNGEFTTLSFPGTGTTSDPYIIQNLNITTESEVGILISDTDDILWNSLYGFHFFILNLTK